MKQDYGAAGSRAAEDLTRHKKGVLDLVDAMARASLVGHFVVVFSSGVFTFLIEAWVFTFLIFGHLILLVLSLIAILAISVYGFMRPRAGAYHRPLAIACAPAALAGAACGAATYDCYGYFATYYSRARSYENVAPLSPAGAVADAGTVLFAEEAYVDTASSAGFDAEDGRRYCVAPVRGAAQSDDVEFWAIGEDCCGTLGGFTCGDLDDKEAHGGVIFVKSGGLFEDPEGELLMRAREKAEAAHGLKAPQRPLYVRWLRNPQYAATYYSLKGFGTVVLWTVAYAAGSAPFVWVACKQFAQRFARDVFRWHTEEEREEGQT